MPERGSPLLIASLATLLLLTGCGDGSESDASSEPRSAPAEVEIAVSDGSFEMPGELEAEPVVLTLQNEGEGLHRAFFVRLNDGVTKEEFEKTLAKSVDALFPLVTLAGNMPEVEAGESTEITMQFAEGNYVVIDPEVKGPPPFGFFTVTSATGPPVDEPSSDYTIETGDFYFEMTDAVAGNATVEITNVGEQGHEVGIGKGPHGDDGEVTTIFAPAPGGRLWTDVDLQPGEYTLVCFFPDPKTNKPHFKLGMELPFEVK